MLPLNFPENFFGFYILEFDTIAQLKARAHSNRTERKISLEANSRPDTEFYQANVQAAPQQDNLLSLVVPREMVAQQSTKH